MSRVKTSCLGVSKFYAFVARNFPHEVQEFLAIQEFIQFVQEMPWQQFLVVNVVDRNG